MKKQLFYLMLLVCSYSYAQTIPSGSFAHFEFTNGSKANSSAGTSGSAASISGSAPAAVQDRDFTTTNTNAAQIASTLGPFSIGIGNYSDSTISLWMKAGASTNNFAHIFNNVESTNSKGTRLILKTNGNLTVSVVMGTTSSDVGGFTTSTGLNLRDSQWHHIVLRTRLQSGTNLVYDVFVDGVKQTSISGQYGNGSASTGLYNNSTMEITSGTYNGAMDDVIYYQSALTDTQITTLYTSDPFVMNQRPRAYVNTNVSGGANDGTSWANAYSDLQAALNSVYSYDEIWVAKGTYTPSISDVNETFSIRDNIYGGFAGTEANLIDRDLSLIHTTNATILSGDLNGNDPVNYNLTTADYTANATNNRSDNSKHVVTVIGNGLEVNGFTIKNGYANGTSGNDRFGGGIFKEVSVSNLTVKNCIVKNNVSTLSGAGLSLTVQSNSVIVIDACIIKNNLSSAASGFDYHLSGHNKTLNITIANSLFDGNKTGSNSSYNAAGAPVGRLRAHFTGAVLSANIINNTFVNNYANVPATNTGNRPLIGISKNDGSFGNINIVNNIFWSNSSNVSSNPTAIGRTSGSYDQMTTSSTRVIDRNIDPNNFINISGPTNTSTVNPNLTADYKLTLTSSSALDNGNNASVIGTKDLAGNDRTYNSNVDRGAYEYTPPSFSGITWTGASNTNWNSTANWSGGVVPTITDDVLIPAGPISQPVLNTNNNYANNVTIESGATLTVGMNNFNSEINFTIEGDLNQQGSFIVYSDNSFIHLKGDHLDNDIEYKRYMSSSVWELISPPVSGGTIFNIATSFATSGNKYSMATYNNALATNRYVYYTNSAGTNDITGLTFDYSNSGKGYSMKPGTSQNVTFTGKIFVANWGVTLSDGSAMGNKWNLLGNPYTTNVNINSSAGTDNLLTTNAATLDPSKVALYVWDSSTSSYDIINQASDATYLKPTQGFFVEAATAGPSVGNIFNFTTAMQTTNRVIAAGSSSVRGATQLNTKQSVKVFLTEGEVTKSTEIKYLNNTSLGLDIGYDAGVFSATDTSFNIYTHLLKSDNKTNFALQCLPKSNHKDMVIPLGINAKMGSKIVLSAKSSGLPSNMKVYLEDKLNNSFTRIDNESYKTTLNTAANGVGRFYLHTSVSKPSNEVPNLLPSELKMFMADNSLKVLTKEINQKATIKVFNLLGKQVFTKTFNSKGSNDIVLPTISAGVYILDLTTEKEGTLNKKIVIN
ncbi:T9SS type A sorting domain-containing protein [Tenacibaculum insulae]|uniref:T9SS type A sorting domain-containing protein n=1 Tax=Tenacibaculum insulae TaxID=2029677 RepID=UPI003AB6E132